MVRRTKEEAAATRELLLDTAEKVFLERGVTRASLQDVASAAGVTRGAIYWHFKDKAELFNAMMDRAILPCEAAGSCGLAAGDDPRPPLDVLRDMLITPLTLLRDDERTRRAFTIAIHRTEYNEDLRAVMDRQSECIGGYLDDIAAVLTRARERGDVRADLPVDASTYAMFSMIDGLLSRCTRDVDPAEGVRMAQVGLDLFIAGMRP